MGGRPANSISTRVAVIATTVFLATLRSSPCAAQAWTYNWDGDQNTAWNVSANWDDGVGNPGPPSPDPSVPDATVRVEIGKRDRTVPGFNDPVISDGVAAVCHQLRIGRGYDWATPVDALLTMTGGTLDVITDKMRIGNNSTAVAGGNGMAGSGKFVMSGGILHVGDGTTTIPEGDIAMG